MVVEYMDLHDDTCVCGVCGDNVCGDDVCGDSVCGGVFGISLILLQQLGACHSEHDYHCHRHHHHPNH